MARTSKAVYLGNNDDVYYGFTVGKEYEIVSYTDDDLILIVDDDGECRGINNGAFHKFELSVTECAAAATGNNKRPDLRYYINGHEVDMIEFENVRYKVDQLDEDGVKCDTIKFEVKFE
ncbi:virion structural protein [Escherichia phage vB_EcoS-IME253]|uniref:Uncharacterized protein n=2 Tax=Rtpvirus TaxID=1920864 RepID=A0A1P8DUQ4_9CAUD|nr:virion structural protein [Escherichia phage vB_EcoS-IME253]APU93236.1 hypothetical protein [Escherichia phage vB_EcoS-IME253]UMO77931.1 hypothetical protein [Escherichia phage ZL19]